MIKPLDPLEEGLAGGSDLRLQGESPGARYEVER